MILDQPNQNMTARKPVVSNGMLRMTYMVIDEGKATSQTVVLTDAVILPPLDTGYQLTKAYSELRANVHDELKKNAVKLVVAKK